MRGKWFFKLSFGALLAISQTGCSLGGGVTSASSAGPSFPFVAAPTIASPATNPYYSSGNSVTISGMCQSGDSMLLFGAGNDEQVCANSTYAFTVTQMNDGLYPFLITQKNPNTGTSSPASFLWIRKTSVSPPVITFPPVTPYASSEPRLVIVGNCETNATVVLSGDATGSANCVNSAFTITVPKAADGDYTINVSQMDPAGNVAGSTIVWNKHVLSVNPPNPVLVVQQPEQLYFYGGEGHYNVVISPNNSGSSFDPVTRVFTPGPIANVADTLVISDNLGATINYVVNTVAGAADHLVFPAVNGNSQSQVIGKVMLSPLAAQVVDRYGNGIPAFPLLFQVIRGDGKIVGTPVRATNAGGFATAQLRAGQSSIDYMIRVAPLTGTLPDAAVSGHPTLTFVGTGTTTGRNIFGAVFGVGNNPGASVISDFNGDGIKDVAVLNVGEPSVGILLGKTSGLFGAMSRVGLGLCVGPNSIVARDFNGDGKVDLAIACPGGGMVVVSLGNGDGTFGARVAIPLDSNESLPSAIACADFDLDGKLDLAVTSAGAALIAVRFGAGNGTFGTPVLYAAGDAPVALAPIDINRDGFPDLVVANSSNDEIGVFTNDTHGAFGLMVVSQSGLQPSALAVKDFDGDTFPDVAVVNSGEDSVSVFTNDAAGGLLPGLTMNTGGSPTALAVLDANSDGHPDIAVANSGDGTVSLFAGLGGGVFNPIPNLSVVGNPVFIQSGRINADGYDDLLISGGGNQELQIVPGRGGGVMGFESPGGNNPSGTAMGDFDEDGKMDMAVVAFASNSLRLLKGDGQGLFAPLLNVPAGTAPSSVIAADFNLDGHLDVAVTSQTLSNVRVSLGVGDGTFVSPATDYQTGLQPRAVIAQDFDADGILDLAVANGVSNSVSIFKGLPNGAFAPKVDFAAGTLPVALVASDFNGDQKLDLAVANNSSDSVSIMLGNGDLTFQTHIDYVVGSGPISIIAEDLNRDAVVDVAVTNSSDGSISVLIGDGDGSMRTALGYSCGPTPIGLVTGDFNKDGKLDLAVANGPSMGITILPGTGNGQFNSSNTLSTGGSSTGLITGDLNDDGALDFLIQNETSNAILFWPGL